MITPPSSRAPGAALADRVSGQDVVAAAGWLGSLLENASATDLSRYAGTLAWSCWRTVEHVIDDLIAYALQLAAQAPLAYVPLVGPRGEEEIAHVDPQSGPLGLSEALRAAAALLATQVTASGPQVRAFHPFGLSDSEGFAAMGVLEILVHAHDVHIGLTGESTVLPEEMSAAVLTRLFPDVPDSLASEPAGHRLLWCTGRIALGDQPRRTRWRWDSSVR